MHVDAMILIMGSYLLLPHLRHSLAYTLCTLTEAHHIVMLPGDAPGSVNLGRETANSRIDLKSGSFFTFHCT